jgi:hypothetical protein
MQVLFAINQPLFLDQHRVYPGDKTFVIFSCEWFLLQRNSVTVCAGTIICVAPGSENNNCW